MWSLLLACSVPSDPAVPHPLADPAARLIRASLLVRGHRPSPEEFDAFRADGDLDAEIARMMEEEAFTTTARDMLAEFWRTRVTHRNLVPTLGPLEGRDRGAVTRSIGEAPLWLGAQVIREGRPFTEVVTADELWVDAHVADVFGLPFDPAGEPWQVAPAGTRPAAGILAHDALWFRHITGDANAQRSRAEFVFDRLLCDSLSDVPLPVANLDPSTDAVSTDPVCLTCHTELDPLAANFFAYRRYALSNEIAEAYLAGCTDPALCYPLDFYEADDASGWVEAGLPAPAFAGQTTVDLAAVGAAVAADPRFLSCAARRLRGWLTQVPPEDLDPAVVAADTATLVAHGGSLADLWAEIVASPEVTGTAAPGPLVLRPEALAATIEAATGFRWRIDPNPGGCPEYGCTQDVDVLQDDLWGLRVLAGGQDGWDVLDPTHAPTATRVLTLERLADKAADFVVTTEFAVPALERTWLRGVEPATVARRPVTDQIVALRAHWFGTRPDPIDREVEADVALWTEVATASGTRAAWRAVLAHLLSDPTVELF